MTNRAMRYIKYDTVRDREAACLLTEVSVQSNKNVLKKETGGGGGESKIQISID
jgi:hypothetical protein